MLRKTATLLTLLVLSFNYLWAAPPDEGMWLPMFIERLNYQDMKKMGLKLSPEEIYSVNNSSLKDAVVMLGGGFCTAEVISSQGLLLTNHHCAYDLIQNHSSVENDYLTDGFWAKSFKEEIPNEGLTASFLVRMEDVTAKINGELTADMEEAAREEKIAELSKQLEEESSEGGRYEVSVKSFYEGNEFYLFVYETFNDVRLVGAPPESIGKFGGDTDNWMWPRHTGDFAMLRIYAGGDNQPAEYSDNNKPYQPKKHLPISIEGVRKGDFAMVMGFPGSTDRYLSSYGVELAIEQSNPKRVEIREERLALMKEDMNASEEIRIKYASLYAQVSNYWKYFIGQTEGLKRLNVLEQKQALEQQFQQWANAEPSRKERYGEVLSMLEEGYTKRKDINVFFIHLNESMFGTQILPMAYQYAELQGMLQQNADEEALNEKLASMKEDAKEHFEEYNAPTDEKILAALLEKFYFDVPEEQRPEVFNQIEEDFEGDFEKFAETLFSTSMFASEAKLMEFLDNPEMSKLQDDLAMQTTISILTTYFSQIMQKRNEANTFIDKANRLFVEGLRKMNPSKKYYPNANSTMRLTYGQILDYFPEDAALYSYYTTAGGILQKEDPNDPEFVVPDKLKTLLQNKDYGRYGYNGKLRVGFISNNDITGGNSGSPVINGEGELIGIAFDGNWEAMSGDIAFEPDLQRCISVDIRYVLFIIDKFAGAQNLINEMTIIDKKDAKAKEFEAVMDERY